MDSAGKGIKCVAGPGVEKEKELAPPGVPGVPGGSKGVSGVGVLGIRWAKERRGRIEEEGGRVVDEEAPGVSGREDWMIRDRVLFWV